MCAPSTSKPNRPAVIMPSRWDKVATAIKTMLEEGAFDLAREFISFLEKKEQKKEADSDT